MKELYSENEFVARESAFSGARALSTYTLTRRAVAYMMATPIMRPPKLAPDSAGVLDWAESFSRSRVTS